VIYLFSDQGYGEAFIRTASRIVRDRGVPVTLVLSTRKTPAPRGLVAGLRRRIGTRASERRLGRKLGLPVRLVRNVNADDFVRGIAPTDHGVIAGFNQIFKAPLIERFASVVNFHPSLLPYYRGPVPSYWCLHHGETSSGFTLHRVTPRIDDGEFLRQEIVAVEPGDDPLALTRRIADRAQPVLERYIASLDGGDAFETRRVDAAAVYRVHDGYRSSPERELPAD
jgi:methionyl-tRNA formyltransferase